MTRQEQTMNEPTLTDTERDALAEWLALYLGNYTLPANYIAPLYDQTHRDVAKYCGPVIAEDLIESDWLRDLVAARVAEAVDRERAAWVAKIEALLLDWRGLPVWGPNPQGLMILDDVDSKSLMDDLRGLLAADDTEEIHPSVQWVADAIAAAVSADDTEGKP